MAELECLHDAERKELSRESHEKKKKDDKDRDKRKSDKKHSHGESKSRKSKSKREDKDGYRERSHRNREEKEVITEFASDDRFIVERDDKELLEKEDKEWLKARIIVLVKKECLLIFLNNFLAKFPHLTKSCVLLITNGYVYGVLFDT